MAVAEAASESSDGTDCLHYHSSCLSHFSNTEAVLSSRDNAPRLEFLRDDQVVNSQGCRVVGEELYKM